MKRLIFISVITVIFCIGVSGQRAGAKKPSGATQQALQNQYDEDAVPVVKDVEVYVNFGNDETASVEVKTSHEPGRFTKGQLGSFLQSFAKVPTIKTSTQKVAQLNPTYVFSPAPQQTLGALAAVFNTVRNPTTNNITIDLNDGLFLYVRRKADTYRPVRPNPLTLLIDIGAEDKIILNGEDEGKLPDLNKLKNHLSDIFKARTVNGVFRESSNTVDTTVNLFAPNSINFDEIQKLVLAISSAGADRIFLAFDRPDLVRKELIQNIETTPVIR